MTASIEGSGERCPTCQAPLAADQRYCLECGSRRGDPRLPFMDAVVFMDTVKSSAEPPPPPPPPRERKPQGITANAAMIAGIGTLVLAIGVGVLIGKAGNNGSATAASAPQIIKVGGSGEEEENAKPEKEESTGGKKKGGKKKDKASASSEEGGKDAAAQVLKPAGDVKLPDSTAQVGEKCEKGTAGCSGNGEFDGSFFGE